MVQATGGFESQVNAQESGPAGAAADEGALTDPHRKAASPNAIHLLRTVQINTLTLSQMADQKANIMIGATFVVFSLSVTRLIGSDITLSMLCLAATAFLSSLCAVIAVLPTFAAPPPLGDRFNLLFFGHFASVDEDEWTERLMDKFGEDDDVFRTMLHDIYQNGRVLYRRKYRFLAYGYRIFLGGLLVTMLVFVGEYAAERGALG